MKLLTRLAGPAAAGLWLVLCFRWFTVADTVRPAWLDAVPPWALALPALFAGFAWLRAGGRGAKGTGPTGELLEPPSRAVRSALFLVLALTAAFRLPIVFQGAAGAVTPDGALSGIVAIHIRDGIDRHVFVPMVPYSGSLKSHLTAPLALVLDPAVAFALSSLLFYVAFAAATCLLAAKAAKEAGLDDGGVARLTLGAGLYLAFSPPYLTRYSLSNDGNYVEVLALGTWAVLLAVRAVQNEAARRTATIFSGVLLGLAFWCHILAVIPMAAVGLAFLGGCRLAVLRETPRLAAGWALGYAPGLLWNVLNDWGSFRYLLPTSLGGEPVPMGEELSVPFWPRLVAFFQDQLPFLLGYDPGHPPALDSALRVFAYAVVGILLAAVVVAVRRLDLRKIGAGTALLVLLLVNVVVAFFALPQIPGNPRYLQPAMASVAVLFAFALRGPRLRFVLVAVVGVGAVSSISQMTGTFEKDHKWRDFVSGIESLGVRYCYTDFFLATNVNFLSRGARRVHGQARTHHDRILLRVPRQGGGGARCGPCPGEQDSSPSARRAPDGPGRQLRADRADEARSVRTLSQGGSRGAVPRARLPSTLGVSPRGARSLVATPSAW